MKIILDVFGADNSPHEIVKGAVDALNQDKTLNLILTGDETKINAELSKYKYDASRLELMHAPDVVTNDDPAATAFRTKKESSLVVALDRIKNDPEVVGMVSAGSTGAVLTGATFKIGRIPGVARPGLAPVLPTLDRKNVLIVDCGATVDSKPYFLTHYAVMGSEFMRNVYGIENPRVALLSNGAEDKKGNELNKAAFLLLKQLPGINFIGNLEARYVLHGAADVIVTDGFAGNIGLKASEGAMLMMYGSLKQEIESSFRAKIGALILKPYLKRMMKRLDYTNHGGAVFLGVEKVVVKSHGSSKARTICASILQAKFIAEKQVVQSIRNYFSSVDEETKKILTNAE